MRLLAILCFLIGTFCIIAVPGTLLGEGAHAPTLGTWSFEVAILMVGLLILFGVSGVSGTVTTIHEMLGTIWFLARELALRASGVRVSDEYRNYPFVFGVFRRHSYHNV